MFREVSLDVDIGGRLFLSPMLGREKPFGIVKDEIDAHQIDRVLSLTSLEEIKLMSPDYHEAIHTCNHKWNQLIFPIPDYHAPTDKEAYIKLLHENGEYLQNGGNLLVHCAAGIGRTGTYAICQLMVLGMSPTVATQLVAVAGSHPETAEQSEFVEALFR